MGRRSRQRRDFDFPISYKQRVPRVSKMHYDKDAKYLIRTNCWTSMLPFRANNRRMMEDLLRRLENMREDALSRRQLSGYSMHEPLSDDCYQCFFLPCHIANTSSDRVVDNEMYMSGFKITEYSGDWLVMDVLGYGGTDEPTSMDEVIQWIMAQLAKREPLERLPKYIPHWDTLLRAFDDCIWDDSFVGQF